MNPVRNAGANPGDILILTKALGTGIISTALKADRVDSHVLQESVNSMLSLNERASTVHG